MIDQTRPGPAAPPAVLPPRLVRRVLPVAVVLAWLGPFSLDTYSPAFPAIQREFGASTGAVQATLATTLIGLALGQLLVGPISDRLGRRRPLLVGLAGYAVASVLCAVAWSIELLIAARLVQGFAAATGIAMARAIARDVHAGAQLARFYSLLAAATAVAPMLAPLLGAALLEAGLSWRWIFGVTLALGLLGLGLVALALPETHPRWVGGTTAARGSAPRRAGTSLWGLLRRRQILVSALVLGLSGAAMIAQLAGMSFYLQVERGFSPAGYSAVFALNAAGMIISNNVNRLLMRRFTPNGVLSVALPVMVASSVAFAVALQVGAPLVVALCALFVLVGCWGFVMPNAVAVGMSVERTAAGRAAAILGTAQFGFGAASAPLVGAVPVVAGVPPVAAVVVVCLAGALLAQLLGRVRAAAVAPEPAEGAACRAAS
ncbi:Bcr/CflA family efflux MFS transporter [Pseudonocardia humida]|uniref:Bcr/CflA family efflux MFS transporter n=1 Tax=Pseudonocardia humida TaxID=2800819 RepID=A0ABT1A2U4_9PSEU|nr:Bcr/CflA family efflux MFS transporter [Pseudonocardia humida]MCO1657331.1 Bcr/CflA family efflux MFS transporter [Pseudonocardia humida]